MVSNTNRTFRIDCHSTCIPEGPDNHQSPMEGKPILVLWDIDGTLISVGGAGERALIHAIRDVFHLDRDLTGVDFSGRTDRRIAHMLHEHFGIPKTDESLQHFMDAYIHHLEIEMKATRMHVLPGVKTWIETIASDPDLYHGLLTGNLEKGAEIKLKHFGLWQSFPFGAFSNLSMDRNELAKFALIKATECTGIRFDPSNVYVIGDTPHDIECGKFINAKTIAVSTGRFTTEQLEVCNPDYNWAELQDPKTFFESIKT